MKATADHFCRFIFTLAGLLLAGTPPAQGDDSARGFATARTAYQQQDYALAARGFAELATNSPSAGIYLNLGNARWLEGRVGEAIMAWERAAQIDPFIDEPKNNLKYARQVAQVESPDWSWCEVAAGWLPAAWWAGLASASLWSAVAVLLLPRVLRWRRSAWPEALAALGLGGFLLAIPANYGVWTRGDVGFVLQPETKLRFTPTDHAEAVTTLASGEPGRVVRSRTEYWLVQTRRAEGWIRKSEFALPNRP